MKCEGMQWGEKKARKGKPGKNPRISSKNKGEADPHSFKVSISWFQEMKRKPKKQRKNPGDCTC